ncbi:hypothetical protein [Bradyrhizobium sp.]|uniref:hypothetical protein n=1 Tax=Bradyrhizobium sp. TaxID=376 RepID=UPI003C65B6DB
MSTRQHFPDGSSYNPDLDTVTFGLTLPVTVCRSMIEGAPNSAHPILNCLARSIETQRNPLAAAALKAVFDYIYERTSESERRLFPNWFDSR